MGLFGAHFFMAVQAAPLDTFLTANQRNVPGEYELELSYDQVNSTVDIFNIRANDADYAGTNVGDYEGVHLRAGTALTPHVWIDGALWQRRLHYRNDVAAITSWQAAGQYKLLEGEGSQPSLAVRAGVWGNTSGELVKSSPTTASGVTLNTVNVRSPQDLQFQMDVIATFKPLPSAEVSVFGGAGSSRVSISGVTGTTTQGGCNYDVNFGTTSVTGTLAQLCNASLVIDRFSVPNAAYGIDVYKEAQYSATYLHAGMMGKWVYKDLQLRGGYQFLAINRGQLDDTIRSRGGVAHEANHIFAGEVMYRLYRDAGVFVRGQYLANQFVGEIPFAYNTLTAKRFDKHYGILSTGIVVVF